MRIALGAATVLLVAVTGCSGAPFIGGGESGGSTGGGGARQESLAALGEPLTTRELVREGTTYALDLYPLRRSGETVQLDARIRYVQVGTYPDRMVLVDGRGSPGDVDGFRLVDGAAQQIHLPAVYGNDQSACSPTLPSASKAGDEVYITCLFGVPQSTTVDVTAAAFGSFPGVEIK